MNNVIKNTLNSILKKYTDLLKSLDGLTYENDEKQIKEINILLSKYEEIVNKYKKYLDTTKLYNENINIINNESDNDLIGLAKEDNIYLGNELKILDKELQILLIPKDPKDNKNVIIEIRGAAGGDEANIFVGDLFRMYCKYCEYNKWNIEILNSIESDSGGFTQIEFFVRGKNVFQKLKYESGVHRVQRIPKTESRGRVHTSTISVTVLPEVEDVEISINPKDLRIDTYRASGAGGQHVNKTDSAVRITHIPSGIIVTSQDGRSQHSNRETAMKHLKAKLISIQNEQKTNEIQKTRSKAVGTGARSEKIRTYNYPQNRITDHRVPISLNKLDIILNSGNGIEEIITSLISFFQQKYLNELK